jgi:RecB family endonuclease NucS
VEVATLLGFSERYVFRGFGDEHSGLKLITEETFNRIRDAFFTSSRENDRNRVAHANAGRCGAGGEGPEHLALKRKIAEEPANVLNEPGLRLWNEEWLLPTMDRVDLVLRDSLDRFVPVEVEVDCDATELPGALQCMKYRAMLSYFFERPIEEVRCILAAHSIHGDVQRRCARHSIEVKAVEREACAGNAGEQ